MLQQSAKIGEGRSLRKLAWQNFLCDNRSSGRCLTQAGQQLVTLSQAIASLWGLHDLYVVSNAVREKQHVDIAGV